MRVLNLVLEYPVLTSNGRVGKIYSDVFSIPKDFRISTYHHFRFNGYWKDTSFARSYCSSDHWDRFAIVQSEIHLNRLNGFGEMESSSKSIILPLSELKATKDLNRADYLTRNICDKYYVNDGGLKAKFFAA